MKVTFEFDTDKNNFDPTELARVQKADDLALALWRFDEAIRHWRRTQDTVSSDAVASQLYEILEGLEINLDKLIR